MTGPVPEQRNRRAPLEPAAILTLAMLALVWSWWAWEHGAWFATVALPGTIVLCVIAGLLAAFAPWRANLSLSPPTKLALAALVGLGLWTLASALWSPTPDVAVGDGQRVLTYAVAFGLGIWLCNLLGPRMQLSQVPLAAAGALAGIATIITLVGDTEPLRALEGDGTLDYPLGYRNANAAFFALAMFPAVAVAADRDLDWRLRGLALGTATLCIDLFLLSQSRGSVVAMAIALLVFVLASPLRLRALCWLALAALPALGILPALGDLYNAANDEGIASVRDEMSAAGLAAAATAAVAALLGGLAARLGPRIPGLGSTSGAGNRNVAVGIAVVLVLGVAGFVAAVGDPVEWIGDRAEEFRSAGSPDLSEESSRFTFNAGSDRADLWGVALETFADDPLFGEGSGGYQYEYTAKREVALQNARDAHSVELENLAELGLPGLGLLLTALAGAAVAIVRARRLGPSAATLGATALAVGAYWLAHASIDWFWAYPALTAPVLALAGSACAPAALDPGRRGRIAWRPWLVAGLAVLAVSAVPPWLAEHYVDDAYDRWRTDPDRAYSDLDRARTLNPLSDAPLLAEGAIARKLGDRERSVAALREATEKRPREWAAHHLLAELLRLSDRDLARNEVRVALELNPRDPEVRRLARSLGLNPAAETGVAD